LLEAWPGPWAAWAKNYCRKNLWRLKTLIGEEEDLLAECALIFLETKQRYGASINSSAHFMSLFQVSVISWFNTYSKKDTRYRTYLESLSSSEPYMEEEATFHVKVREVSKEVLIVLNIMQYAPIEIFDRNKRGTGQFIHQAVRHCKIPKRRYPLVIKGLRTLLTA
jgi:hypothetical protein